MWWFGHLLLILLVFGLGVTWREVWRLMRESDAQIRRLRAENAPKPAPRPPGNPLLKL